MKKSNFLQLIVLSLLATPAGALTFTIKPGSDIVGNVQTTTVQRGENIDNISERFDVGVYEIIEANPHINPRRLSTGERIVIPTQFILPPGPRSGIVINLAEMRLYYFHKDKKLVTTHPISIGRPEWETPIASGKVIDKTKDPSWHPPKSIRAWYDERDMFLPAVVPPGPDNPLGKFALRLSITGYLIHGTNMYGGIGIRTSSGCIRMWPKDIESLYYKVSVGDAVRIIHEPYKLGRHAGQVFAESHEPLSGDYYNRVSESELINKAIEEARKRGAKFDVEIAKRALMRSQGYPTVVE